MFGKRSGMTRQEREPLTDDVRVDAAGLEERLHAVAESGHSLALAADRVDEDQQLSSFACGATCRTRQGSLGIVIMIILIDR